MKLSIIRLVVCIVVCQLAGVIGSLFTTSSIPTWYAALNKPSFNPPNWIFGPVWITLYLLMGISLYLVWSAGINNPAVRVAVVVFGVQLLLNALWSIVFFGMHSPIAGMAVIVLLWAGIVASMVLFFPISPAAAYLLIPYILWVSFAAVLNFFLWRLN